MLLRMIIQKRKMNNYGEAITCLNWAARCLCVNIIPYAQGGAIFIVQRRQAANKGEEQSAAKPTSWQSINFFIKP